MANNGGYPVLPPDIIRDVFLRLCEKSLATFKIKICGKMINSMCKGTTFLARRREIEKEEAIQKPKVIFTYLHQGNKALAIMSSPSDPGIQIDPGAEELAAGIFGTVAISNDKKLVSSVKGLALLLGPFSFQICDPTTGVISEDFVNPNVAIQVHDEHVKIGFGFDGSLDRYKLVRMRNLANAAGTHIELFTLGNGNHHGDDDWREGPVVPELGLSINSEGAHVTVGNTTFVNYLGFKLEIGDDDWSDDEKALQAILSFNLTTELATVINLPTPSEKSNSIILSTLVNKLCVSYYNPILNHLTIYALADFGDPNSWGILVEVQPRFIHSSHFHVPIPLNLHGNTLILAVHNDLIDDQPVLVEVLTSKSKYLNLYTSNPAPVRSTIEWISTKPFVQSHEEMPHGGIPAPPLVGVYEL